MRGRSPWERVSSPRPAAPARRRFFVTESFVNGVRADVHEDAISLVDQRVDRPPWRSHRAMPSRALAANPARSPSPRALPPARRTE